MINVVGLAMFVSLASSVPALAPEAFPGTFPGSIGLKSYTITLVGTAPTNGDNDGYADTDETVDFNPTFVNRSNVTINHLSLTLTSSSPTIECIGQSELLVTSVASGATFTTAPFRFKVAGPGVVNRTNTDQTITADFKIMVQAEGYVPPDPLAFTLHLDLNASGGGGTSAFLEGFEIGGTNFGKFTLATLDAGKNTLASSDGMRCQYTDPDSPFTYGHNANCFLGFAGDPSQGINDWHVHDGNPLQSIVARAYAGTKSLHWGTHNFPSSASADGTRLKQMDAVKSLAINLPLPNVAAELTFAHQISLLDNRSTGITPGEAADRAVVQVMMLNANGQETGLWKSIAGYENGYNATGADGIDNCTFDPTDDGNNEDSLFDPAHPENPYGPSSACSPSRVFACGGSTDYRFAANPASLCGAYGPGLAGSIDVGTWVQPRFNLQEFGGRRIKIRFLATSVEVGTSQEFSQGPPGAHDGWYIDDVRVNSALGIALTVTADTKTITPLACPTCASVQAALSVSPNTLPGPGNSVTLSGYGTSVDSCPNGTLEYQFWIDENDNGVAGDAGDTLLRDFSNLWSYSFVAWSSNRFAVLARCSSVTACDSADGSNTASALLSVTCPTGVDHYALGRTITLSRYGELFWSGDATIVDVIRGWLVGTPSAPATSSLRASGSFTGTVAECASNYGPATWIEVEEFPGFPGTGFYYLVRGQPSESCAATPPGYTTNAPKERPGRDAELETDPTSVACP